MRLERLLMPVLLVLALAGCATGGSHSPQLNEGQDDAQNAARVHTELAQHYMQQGHLKAALGKLQLALKFDDNYAPAHTVLGVLYERIGETAKAEEQKRRAVELMPKDGDTNNNYAVFLCQEGKYAQAMTYFKHAVADPFYATPSVAYSNAGSCMVKAGNYKQAETEYRRALKVDPKNADAMLHMAAALYKDNDAFHARAFMQRYEATGTPTAVSLQLGRDIESRLGNGEGAQDYARRLRQQFPDSEQAQALHSKPGP